MTRAERAQLIWQVLIGGAHYRQILTYSILGDLVGAGAGTLAQTLGLVMNYCARNGLPPLTVLVVNKETGLPGAGLTTLEDLARDREAVFNHKWFLMNPPPTSAFQSTEAAEAPTSPSAAAVLGENSQPWGGGPPNQHLPEFVTGKDLNTKWQVGAKHALYHHEGRWYHKLERFPGALFDKNGYVLFKTRELFLHSPYLKITQDVHVPTGISEMPDYVRKEEPSEPGQS